MREDYPQGRGLIERSLLYGRDGLCLFEVGSFAVEIDCVYIDAMHTYEAVKSVIQNTIGVVKPRVVISGHNYTDSIEHVGGVKKVVDEIIGTPDFVCSDMSWLKYAASGVS